MIEFSKGTLAALLGCKLPLVLAGMGGVARAELVGAVTDAGGFGFLGMVREPPELIAHEISELRAQGCSRFGVNLIPAATDPDLLQRQIAVCIAEKVPVVCLFWDMDLAVVNRLRQAGIMVAYQVGSVEEALAAEAAGCGLIIAQGVEAGGHVRGTTPLAQLLPAVVDAVSVPVLAAGGLGSGADLVTAMGLGADGIVIGTAFMAAAESYAHTYHKQALVAAEASDTVLTDKFHINWPRGAMVRVLDNPVTRGERGDPFADERIVIGDEAGRAILRFSTDSPSRVMIGAFADMALYAGTGVGSIEQIAPAAVLVDRIMAGAQQLLEVATECSDRRTYSSAVCYVDEVYGDYNGQLDADQLDADLLALEEIMTTMLSLALAPSGGTECTGAPPFNRGAADYAGWLLRLREISGHTGCRSRTNPELGELAALHASARRQLGATIPRLADGPVRDTLVALRVYLEN